MKLINQKVINNINEFLNDIKNNGKYHVCCPLEYKKLILEKISEDPLSYNVSFYTIEQLVEKLTFSYDQNAIYYLMDRKKYNYDEAITYLKNMLFSIMIENKDEKVEYLKSLYSELLENKIIDIDELFINFFKQEKLIICGYSVIKKEYQTILEKIYSQEITWYIFDCPKNNNIFGYLCNNNEEELHLMLENVSKLIKDGVPLDKIKVIGINNKERARLLFSYYNIPVNYDDSESIVNFPIINKDSIEDIDVDSLSNSELEIYQQYIDCLNSIHFTNGKNEEIKKEIISKKINQLKIQNQKFKNAIDIINYDSYLDNYIYSDCYLFILGLNEGILPKLHKDEDYFKDSLKMINNINTSYFENEISRKNLKNLINSCKYVHISCSSYGDTKLYPSSIIKELEIKLNDGTLDYSQFSDKYNKLLLVRKLDLLRKYGTKQKALDSLFSTYQMNDYLKYDNQFKVKDKEKYQETIRMFHNGKIKLSYSSLNLYYSCPFAYYAGKILKVNKYEDNFANYLGSLFHYVLEKVFSNNIFTNDYIDNAINEFISTNNDYQLTKKDRFLLERLLEELKEIIEAIRAQNDYLTYPNSIFEKELQIVTNDKIDGYDIEKEFSGKIDKIYYKEVKIDGEVVTYVSLIDYKTGKANIELDLLEYGLSMQLPIYIYLTKEAKLANNIKIGGLFIQEILNKDIKLDIKGDASDESLEEAFKSERFKNLKLNGYLASDNDGFDSSENNSLVIYGLRKKLDGNFYGYSKILSDEQISDIFRTTQKVINDAYRKIFYGDFKIEAKYLKDKVDSCKYCNYRDLCYKTYNNIIHIKKGGEDNA